MIFAWQQHGTVFAVRVLYDCCREEKKNSCCRGRGNTAPPDLNDI